MRRLLTAATLTVLLAQGAYAQCVGTGAFRTCSDSSGNRYTVQDLGNTTIMRGSNPRTGSTWNQTSQTFGNTTINRGTSSNGGNWSTTRQDFGNGNYSIQGFDSNGNSVNKRCFGGICN